MRSRMLLVLPVLVAGWLLAVASPAAAFKVYGPVWRDDDITYYNTYGPYDRFVERGVRAWNASGMRARFRRVGSASKADVRIGLFGRPAVDRLPSGVVGYTNLAVLDGRVSSARACASRGSRRAGWRRTARSFSSSSTTSSATRSGLDHEQGTCAVLNASVRPVAGPQKCGTPPRGKRYCRLLELDDERGAVSLYGGRPAPISRPRFC